MFVFHRAESASGAGGAYGAYRRAAASGASGPQGLGPTPLPPRVVFRPSASIDVVVADLPITADGPAGPTAPFFLEHVEYDQLLAFVREPSTAVEQLLVLTGPIKGGKTSVLTKVIPGLVAAEYLDGKRQSVPVVFSFSFHLRSGPDDAARLLLLEARVLAEELGFTSHCQRPLTTPC